MISYPSSDRQQLRRPSYKTIVEPITNNTLARVECPVKFLSKGSSDDRFSIFFFVSKTY